MSRPSDGDGLKKLCRLALVACLVLTAGCETPSPDSSESQAPPEVPQPDMTGMEEQVEQRIRETRGAILTDRDSAEAWGQFGMVAHAHELWEEARIAYLEAERLDPTDVRWPYYLGDVLSVLGTDLATAAAAFRRAMQLRTDYAPAHMRLGKVFFADGQEQKAATELERALELEKSLQPARVTLAQIRLAEGKLEVSEKLIDRILANQPRHAQALSTLGQVYMRQGRRDEARAIAERARSAAIYNLFEDPLMSKVVAEGVSSVLIWERAKAFLDNGNDQQAMLGLRQVIKLKPQNADAHQQLAVAYGNLGEIDRSRRHLERAVTLAPDRVDSLIQLATVQLDQQEPKPAIDHLQRILELDPNDPDARWMLGRAQVMSGDLYSAVTTFERANQAGGDVAAWARNEWGSALAQTGRPDAAFNQFQAALAIEPDNAQSLFYVGLLLEGRGKAREAVEHYCRSMASQPNPPAQGRLQALGARCR